MEKEIGSEFWNAEKGAVNPLPGKTYLSGRTALTAILLDLKSRGVNSVCLPDYLCESMIEPFLRQGMDIGFYPVRKSADGLTLSVNAIERFDAVLMVNYFGFMTDQLRALTLSFQRSGKPVILDQTHAVFVDDTDCPADYVFGSYRKWTGIEAGFAAGVRQSALRSWPVSEDGLDYLSLRNQARKMKQAFVKGNYADESLRRNQLDLFEKAESFLDREYISDTDERNKSQIVNLDTEYIRIRRKNNAGVIYSQLHQLNFCIPMFSELADDVVPLAVPVLIPQEKRNSLRTYLREHGVFCPVHWPLSALHQAGNDALRIYNSELSLVCDQRYDVDDMARIMEMIKQWEKITSE